MESIAQHPALQVQPLTRLLKWIIWYLVFFVIGYCMVMDAQAHGIHLVDVTEHIVQGSLKGHVFMTDDGSCWEIYKDTHVAISTIYELHIRRIDCE